MQLTDFARKVPEEVWRLFEPILPPVVWCGNGCPPYDNRECLHAVLYVLVTGIGWRMLPAGFPSYKTVQRRLKLWLQRDTFRQAWGQLAQKYERLQGRKKARKAWIRAVANRPRYYAHWKWVATVPKA